MRGPGVCGGNSRAGEAVLRFSAAPKGPKQESPGGGNPACGVGPGDPIRMRIRPALKGRNKILDHNSISQGCAWAGMSALRGESKRGARVGWIVHWGLNRDPFVERGGPYVPVPGHEEAVARLVHTIEAGHRLAVLSAGRDGQDPGARPCARRGERPLPSFRHDEQPDGGRASVLPAGREAGIARVGFGEPRRRLDCTRASSPWLCRTRISGRAGR